jgi:hypothetical protein
MFSDGRKCRRPLVPFLNMVCCLHSWPMGLWRECNECRHERDAVHAGRSALLHTATFAPDARAKRRPISGIAEVSRA